MATFYEERTDLYGGEVYGSSPSLLVEKTPAEKVCNPVFELFNDFLTVLKRARNTGRKGIIALVCAIDQLNQIQKTFKKAYNLDLLEFTVDRHMRITLAGAIWKTYMAIRDVVKLDPTISKWCAFLHDTAWIISPGSTSDIIALIANKRLICVKIIGDFCEKVSFPSYTILGVVDLLKILEVPSCPNTVLGIPITASFSRTLTLAIAYRDGYEFADTTILMRVVLFLVAQARNFTNRSHEMRRLKDFVVNHPLALSDALKLTKGGFLDFMEITTDIKPCPKGKKLRRKLVRQERRYRRIEQRVLEGGGEQLSHREESELLFTEPPEIMPSLDHEEVTISYETQDLRSLV